MRDLLLHSRYIKRLQNDTMGEVFGITYSHHGEAIAPPNLIIGPRNWVSSTLAWEYRRYAICKQTLEQQCSFLINICLHSVPSAISHLACTFTVAWAEIYMHDAAAIQITSNMYTVDLSKLGKCKIKCSSSGALKEWLLQTCNTFAQHFVLLLILMSSRHEHDLIVTTRGLLTELKSSRQIIDLNCAHLSCVALVS